MIEYTYTKPKKRNRTPSLSSLSVFFPHLFGPATVANLYIDDWIDHNDLSYLSFCLHAGEVDTSSAYHLQVNAIHGSSLLDGCYWISL